MIAKLRIKQAKLRLKVIKYCRRCGRALTNKELKRSQFVCNECMIEQLNKLKDL